MKRAGSAGKGGGTPSPADPGEGAGAPSPTGATPGGGDGAPSPDGAANVALPGEVALWRDAIILDAGDAFMDMPSLPADRAANAIATAELLIDHWNAEGMDAQAIGDRDLALGRAALEALQARAKYPFITTNLMDAGSGKPLFKRFHVIDVGEGGRALQLGIFGLISARGGGPDATLRIEPPIEALKSALDEARAAGVDVFIVLSQLSARDETAVAEAVPEVQLFLGGDGMGTSPDAENRGQALAFQGGQKGKHLGLLRLGFDDPAGAGAPLFDPTRKSGLERKKAEAQRRIEMYERLIAEAAATPTTAAAPDAGESPQPSRRRAPAEMYERQLAAARAELQLAEQDLASIANETGEVRRNTVSAELVPLGRDVADDPAIKSRIDEFRKTWPDPTPGH